VEHLVVVGGGELAAGCGSQCGSGPALLIRLLLSSPMMLQQ